VRRLKIKCSWRRHSRAVGSACLVALAGNTARAETSGEDASKPPFAYATLRGAPRSDGEFLPDCDPFCFAHVYGTWSIGRGLRFNNPYRLNTVLGSDAESLSFTAPYTDVALAAVFGDPYGFQQGMIVSASFALSGVPQQVLAPGYAAVYRLGPRTQLRSSLSLPWVLQPDANLGLDVAAGAAFMLFAGFGISSSLVMSLYEGAATDQRAATLIPILSLQGGLTIDYEVLP
jgi:hypothetical protein